MANKFPLILNTSANQIQEIASGDNLDLTGCGINNAGVITATSFSGNITGAVTGNADTATLATNVTVSANNSNNETVYPIFVDGTTGTQGAESDTGLTYNPSSGNLTSTQFTGTLQTAAQPNITSVGTLSSLDVSGNVSIGGTLTYEDVTNIDSVGLVTARTGVVSPYADIDDWIDVGNNIQLGNAGVITATTFRGDGDFVELDVDGHTNLDNVSVAGVTTTQDVTFTGASSNMSWIKSSNALNLAAATQLHIGDGAEFKAYRSGTHTYLAHTNSNGNFFIKSQANLALQAGGSTTGINVNGNGEVTLTNSGNIKLATTSSGINITGVTVDDGATHDGDVKFANQSIDNAVNWGKVSNILQVRNDTKITFGNSNQLSIYQDAASSGHSLIKGTGYVRIAAESYLQLGTASIPAAFFNCESATGSVYIAHNGNDKIQTTNTGAVITGICTATDFSGAAGGAADFPNGVSIDKGVAINLTSGNAQAMFPGPSQVNGVTQLPSQVGTPFIVAKDTGTGKSANFAGAVRTGTLGVGIDPGAEFHVKGSGTVARFEGTGGNCFIDLLDSDDTTRVFLGVDGGMFKLQTSANSWSDKFTVTGAGDATFAGTLHGQKWIHANANAAITGTYSTYQYGLGGTEPGGLSIEGGESAIDIVSTDSGEHGGSIAMRTTADGFVMINNPTANSFEIKNFTPSANDFHCHGVGSGVSNLKTQLKIIKDDEVQLSYNGSVKLSTKSFGVQIEATPRVDLISQGNSAELKFFGNGSSHRGSVYADNGDTIGFIRAGTGSWAARWHSDGKQTAHGSIVPNAADSYTLGTDSLRWNNVVSRDMRLHDDRPVLSLYCSAGSSNTDPRAMINFEALNSNNDEDQYRINFWEGVAGAHNANANASIRYNGAATDGGDGSIRFVNDGGTRILYMNRLGNGGTSGSWTTGSDQRKKENITTVSNPLTKVNQLRGVDFKWLDKYGGHLDSGVIAQEIESVLPHLVQNQEGAKEDGVIMKSVNYNGLFGVMIEAIKELSAKVAALEGS